MTYRRYKSESTFSKEEKVELMAEYVNFYEDLISDQGVDALNVKIPREVFSDTLDAIGALLNEQAHVLAYDDGEVRDFLRNNPLPPHMQELLPDEFRAFCLLLNALKQWVSAESAATDRFLLGGTARQTCRAAVDRCIVTGEDLGEKPELHHPMRDGRPPILLSKKGHDFIEQKSQKNSFADVDDKDGLWHVIKQLRAKKHMSWVQLREGCNVIITGSDDYRSGAKSFANTVIKETGLSANDLIERLDKRGL